MVSEELKEAKHYLDLLYFPPLQNYYIAYKRGHQGPPLCYLHGVDNKLFTVLDPDQEMSAQSFKNCYVFHINEMKDQEIKNGILYFFDAQGKKYQLEVSRNIYLVIDILSRYNILVNAEKRQAFYLSEQDRTRIYQAQYLALHPDKLEKFYLARVFDHFRERRAVDQERNWISLFCSLPEGYATPPLYTEPFRNSGFFNPYCHNLSFELSYPYFSKKDVYYHHVELVGAIHKFQDYFFLNSYYSLREELCALSCSLLGFIVGVSVLVLGYWMMLSPIGASMLYSLYLTSKALPWIVSILLALCLDAIGGVGICCGFLSASTIDNIYNDFTKLSSAISDAKKSALQFLDEEAKLVIEPDQTAEDLPPYPDASDPKDFSNGCDFPGEQELKVSLRQEAEKSLFQTVHSFFNPFEKAKRDPSCYQSRSLNSCR